jgi:phosphoglycerate dehydrogenase-like enzyme
MVPDPGADDVPVVVGILYPKEWYGTPEDFARAVADVEALDPRIQVVVETYAEPHELRSARGKPGAEQLRDQAPPLTDAQRAAFADLQVVLAIDLPFDVAAVAPSLRWVQAVGAGTGQLQSAGLASAGVRLTTAAGANAVAIAEFALARVLAEWKRFRALDELQARHQWEPLYGRQLAGSTIGLLGLGAINGAIAARAAAFDVQILATRRSATPGAVAPNVDDLYPPDQLHTMLSRCDAVIAAVPETPETTGLMDAAAFAAMKPGSFFCNVGRGSLVDEPALIDALRRGHLRGAALDVASVEPLPADHPLWEAPNLTMSPHSASAPAALFVNLHELFCDNLTRFLNGEALRNEVDMGRGY